MLQRRRFLEPEGGISVYETGRSALICSLIKSSTFFFLHRSFFCRVQSQNEVVLE